MGTYTLKEYPNVLRRRVKRLKRMKSPMQAARFMIGRGKQRAPNYTRETINSLRSKNLKGNVAKVESFVSGSFKQNIWANRGIANVKAGAGGVPGRFHTPKMRWNKKGGKMQKTLYGKGPANWSGQGGWFNLAGMDTRKKFKDLTIREVSKVMESK